MHGEEGLGAGGSVFGSLGLAEVIDDDIECGEEGVRVERESSLPSPSGSDSKPTLERGHLPLKFRADDYTKRYEA